MSRAAARALLAALLAALLSPAALAMPLPVTAPETPATATASAPAAAIADTTDSGADQRIAARIRGIFGEIPALKGVGVAVREGVVTLTGTVPAQADIARAEAVAGRISGVVTVENKLARDLSIDGQASGIASLAKLWSDFLALAPLLAVALAAWLLIALAGYALAGLSRLWQRIAPNSFLAGLIASAIRFLAVVGGLVIALQMLGATALLGAVLGGAGVIGIALGFAMRDTVENYVASLMLSLRQPFRANDHVVIDTHEGRVIRLTSRATVLMTLEGNHLRIPNGQVFKAVILNYTRSPRRRFDFDLFVDIHADAAAARTAAREALAGLPFVLAEPCPEVRVWEVTPTQIRLRALGWIDQREAEFHKARSEALARVQAALENGGFALPDPAMVMKRDKGAAATKMPQKAASPGDAALVTPADEVAAMVADERAAPSGAEEDDLLDAGRPIE